MSLAVLHSRALAGVEAPPVDVEVHLANGLPSFTIVGLPEAEVKESKDRVRAALQNARFEFPLRRITVNLAPADLPKESGRLDLPIALGILAASGQIPADKLSEYEFAGELALTGALRPIRGALAMTLGALKDGRAFVLPPDNAAEAALVENASVYAAPSLLAVCAHLLGQDKFAVYQSAPAITAQSYADLLDVKGQAHAKRALEIAAAGGHSLLKLFTWRPITINMAPFTLLGTACQRLTAICGSQRQSSRKGIARGDKPRWRGSMRRNTSWNWMKASPIGT